jgi:hypothetical protein
LAQDPLSRVASWLTSVTDPTAATEEDRELLEALEWLGVGREASPKLTPQATKLVVEDPVLALIAEGNRLAALRLAASGRGDEIFDALPEDIREGRVRVSFSDSELGRCLSGPKHCFRSEQDLQSYLDIWRRFPRYRAERDGKSPEAAVAEFDREIGLDQALVQLRAGLEEIKVAREASGYEAHYREAGPLDERTGVLFNQICATPPRTLAGAIAMLELASELLASGEDSCPIETKSLIAPVIEGLHDMQPAHLAGDRPVCRGGRDLTGGFE